MESLDFRLIYTTGLLADKIRDRHIVDLNCGTARLLKYLPPLYATYTCNDITPQDIYSHDGRVMFSRRSDMDLTNDLCSSYQPVDILLCFGLVDGTKTGTPQESMTLPGSILKLAERKQPGHIILETSARWECLYHIINDLRRELRKLGYRVESDLIITPTSYPDTPEGKLTPRRICHLVPGTLGHGAPG